MKAKTTFALAVLCLLSTGIPRGAVGQDSDEGAEAPSASSVKVNPAFRQVDAMIEKASASISSVERCADMRSNLSRQLASVHTAAAAPVATSAPSVPLAADPLTAETERQKQVKADCGANVPLEQIIGDKHMTRWDTGYLIDVAAQSYYLCLAVANQDESACDALKPVCQTACPSGPYKSSADICKSVYGFVRLSNALISHDPSTKKICLKRGPTDSPRPAREIEAECAALLAGESDPAGVCAKTDAKKIDAGGDQKSCEKGTRDYWGLSARCAFRAPPAGGPPRSDPNAKVTTSDDPLSAALCSAANAAAGFRRAHAAHDAELCGTDGICRAMMGEGPKACKAYAAEVQEAKRKFCAGPGAASPDWSREEVPALDKAVKQWDAQTKRRGDELKRKSEEAKRSMDAEFARKGQLQTQAAAAGTKLEQVEVTCLKLEAEAAAAIESVFSALGGIEPKSLPGIRQRVAKYSSLKARWVQFRRPSSPRKR